MCLLKFEEQSGLLSESYLNDLKDKNLVGKQGSNCSLKNNIIPMAMECPIRISQCGS